MTDSTPAAATWQLVNVTTAYRACITWVDGQTTTIGDYPTARIANAAASDFVAANAGGHVAPDSSLQVRP